MLHLLQHKKGELALWGIKKELLKQQLPRASVIEKRQRLAKTDEKRHPGNHFQTHYESIIDHDCRTECTYGVGLCRSSASDVET